MRLSAQTGKNKLLIFCSCCKTAVTYPSACWASELICKVSGPFEGNGGGRGKEMNEKGVPIT